MAEELTPTKIVEELDKYIVGQKNAKKAVAVALRNRWRRLQLPEKIQDEITPKNITVDTSMYYRFIHEADDEIISSLDGIVIKHLQAMDAFLHTYIKLVKEKRRENNENSKSNIAKQMREMFSEYINTQNIDMKTCLLNVKEQLRKRNEPNVKNYVNISTLKNLKRLIEDNVLTTQYNFTTPTERDDEIRSNKEKKKNKEENKMIVNKMYYNATDDEKRIEKIGKEIETNLEKLKEIGFAEKVIFSNVELQEPLHEVLKLQEKRLQQIL